MNPVAELTQRWERAEARIKELEEALRDISDGRGKTLAPPEHISDEMKTAWQVGASRAFNANADIAVDALTKKEVDDG